MVECAGLENRSPGSPDRGFESLPLRHMATKPVTYVALLRGINLGRHKRVSMEDLRGAFDSLGLEEVRTYIQSGNVLFESPEKEKPLTGRLTKHLDSSLGLDTTVMLRTAAEMADVLDRIPFPKKAAPTRVSVSFLSEKPRKGTSLEALEAELEDIRIDGRELFARSFDDDARHRRSRFSNALVEKELGVRSTARNLNTVRKLVELSQAG